MNRQVIQDTILKDSIILKNNIYKFSHEIAFNGSNNDDTQITSNVITISLALIAALIALHQVKSNIISSARITWIENLRNSISEYTIGASNCIVLLKNMLSKCDGKSKEEAFKIIENDYSIYFKEMKETDVLANKILLYLNSKEELHREIEELIKKISKNTHQANPKEIDSDEIEADIDKIIEKSKLIFSKEWTKSKKLFKI